MQEKKLGEEQRVNCEGATSTEEGKEERVITIRPLNMEDFKEAKNQVNECIRIYDSFYGMLLLR